MVAATSEHKFHPPHHEYTSVDFSTYEMCHGSQCCLMRDDIPKTKPCPQPKRSMAHGISRCGTDAHTCYKTGGKGTSGEHGRRTDSGYNLGKFHHTVFLQISSMHHSCQNKNLV